MFAKLTKRINVYWNVFMSLIGTVVSALPNDRIFCRMRLHYWRHRGYDFHDSAIIFRNVYFLGKVSMGANSSVSNNSFLNGGSAGIFIGDNVMIAPGCVLVAFNHGFEDPIIPMVEQHWTEAPIVIEDDVWIAANCTVTLGTRLGRGCIIGANSVVTKDVEPFSIVGGVPAKPIGRRPGYTKEA